nr:MAG TPA: N-terminal domain with HPIH motif [Siphoviridae sp. ctngg6]
MLGAISNILDTEESVETTYKLSKSSLHIQDVLFLFFQNFCCKVKEFQIQLQNSFRISTKNPIHVLIFFLLLSF